MRFVGKARKAVAVGFVAGIGTIGIQDVDAGQGVDADGATDFTARRRRRPFVERPVEPDDPDDCTVAFCVLDIETTGLSTERDAIIEIAVIRSQTRDGVTREQVLDELVRPSGNIPKRIRELTGITNEMVADADTIDRVLPRIAAFVGDAPIAELLCPWRGRAVDSTRWELPGRTQTGWYNCPRTGYPTYASAS